MTTLCCPPAPIPTHSPGWRALLAGLTRGLDGARAVLRRDASAHDEGEVGPVRDGCARLASSLGDRLSRDIGLPAGAREHARLQADRALQSLGW
jgi:hypothetical protein